MACVTDTPRATPRWRTLLVTSATTLAVALVAGLGIWQAGLHGQRSGSGASANQVATRASVSRVTTHAPSSSVPASSGSVRPAPRSVAPQLILVDSTEQAVQLRQGLDAAEALRSQTGVGPLDERVLQINADDERDLATRAVADENSLRAVLGLPPVEVVDLRPPTAVPAQLKWPRASAVPFVVDRQ